MKYKLFFSMMLVFLLVAPMVSSLEIDNWISYEDKDGIEDKVVTLTNWLGLGEEIGTAERMTPQVNYVMRGKNRRVMIFDIENYGDLYKDGIRDLEIIDMETGKPVEKDFHLEYAIYEDVVVEEYNDEKCALEETPFGLHEICRQVLTGTHIASQISSWEDLNSGDIPKGKLTIAIVTDVNADDHFDGIPVIFGRKVSRWAEWTESLNTGLQYYYTLNETSGTDMGDSRGNFTMTSPTEDWVAAKIGNGFHINAANELFMTDNLSSSWDEGVTFAMWINWTAATIATTGTFLATANGGAAACEGCFQLEMSRGGNLTLLVQDTVSVKDTGNPNGQVGFHNWSFVTMTINSTTGRIWINGVLEKSLTNLVSYDLNDDEVVLSAGNTGGTSSVPAVWDELGIWARVLSNDEITQLYNAGSGMTYVDTFPSAPTVNVTSPLNITYTSPISRLNYTVLDVDGDAEDCWYHESDGINSTAVEAGINFTGLTADSGDNIWTVYCNDTTNAIGNSSVTFNLNLIPPNISMTYPQNTTYTIKPTEINYTYSANTQRCWISVDGGATNSTPSSCTGNINTASATEGSNTFMIAGNTSLGGLNQSYVTFFVDTIDPVLSIKYPTGNIRDTSGNSTALIQLNWTVKDTNLANCWYYNQTANVTVSCGNNATFYLPYGTYTHRVYANDSLLNEGSDSKTVTYTYDLLYGGYFFNNNTVESSQETFIMNISTDAAKSISTASLNYNGTNYGASVSSLGSGNYTLTNTLTIPQVAVDRNITLFWITTLNDGTQYNSTKFNQSVFNFAIDNCGSNTVLILNYTLYDEDTRNILTVGASNNVTIELTLNLYDTITSTVPLINFSANYSENYAHVCIGTSSLINSTYYMDVTARYDAGDDYISEFNNIRDHELKTSTIPQHIGLYDLLVTRSQEFLITFKDDNFIRKGDVIVDITRKYLDDGIFRSIEVPITDSNGETLAHFVLGDVIYTMTFKYQGEVLAVLDNFLARCDDVTLGGCQINVNSFSSTISVEDFEYTNDLSLKESFDLDTRTVTTIFNSIAGNKIVSLNVTKFDRFGNQSLCTDQISSSSGTLSCTVPVTFGNVTVLSQIFSDGLLQSQKTYTIRETPTDMYGGSIVILALLMIITLSMLFITTIEGILLGALMGLILSALLGFLNLGSPFFAGASIGWIILAIVIIFWKISHKEESR